jgi:hypothetical protein
MNQEMYSIDLPGKLLYTIPFNVNIRKINVIEQKYILSLTQKEQLTSDEFVKALSRIITFDNPEMNINELYWNDLIYILYQIHLTSFKNFPIRLIYDCDKCKERNKHSLKIEDLDISEPNLNRTIVFENGKEILLDYKKVKDDHIIEKTMKRMNIDQTDLVQRFLILCLCSLRELGTIEEVYVMLENNEISITDINQVENFITSNMWGVKEEFKDKCTNCNEEVSKDYTVSLEDFFSTF